jgi:hypothetical protein
MKRHLLLAGLASILLSCSYTKADQLEEPSQQVAEPQPGPIDLSASSPEGVVRKMIEYYADGEGGVFSDVQFFFRKNGGEVGRTLEIGQTDRVGDSRAVVRYRYSVGTKVFRDVLWVRRVDDGVWIISSDYPDNFDYISLNEWRENSASFWED